MKVNAVDDKAHTGVLTLKRGRLECRIFIFLLCLFKHMQRTVAGLDYWAVGGGRGEERVLGLTLMLNVFRES